MHLVFHEIDKQPLTVKRLPKSGYPDIEISHADHTTYLEIKTSAVKGKSGFRYLRPVTNFVIPATSLLLPAFTCFHLLPTYFKVNP